jgi:hypothetical protein
VGAEATHITGPVFCTRQSRRVDHELISSEVKGGSGLELCNIRAVSELSLGIAPDNLVILNQGHPVLQLFFVTKNADSRLEHTVTEANTRQETLKRGHPKDIGGLHDLRFTVNLGVMLM